MIVKGSRLAGREPTESSHRGQERPGSWVDPQFGRPKANSSLRSLSIDQHLELRLLPAEYCTNRGLNQIRLSSQRVSICQPLVIVKNVPFSFKQPALLS